MKTHSVRTHRSTDDLPIAQHLAYAIAEVAVDPVSVTEEVTEMVINRVIDNAAVAAASLTRAPVVAARSQAADHPYDPGASVAGIEGGFSPEWAAWANGVAVRELDFHDTFLGAEYSHPGDNIPPILAVAQHVGRKGNSSRPLTGVDIVRGIATGYEIQIDLASAISLHAHKIDHVAHLAPSAAAGIGTLLDLDADTVYQAVGQALHTSTATRQSRKGLISNWKAYAPAFAGKVAVESVDRAIRGQTSPSPIYEGEDGVIAWLLGGPVASYEVSLPEPGEVKRAILDSYTKEHSAEYQAQAWIDLAHRLSRIHPEVADPDRVVAIVIQTSHHTHSVIGSGANDPQKYDPYASRETLDHSLPYIFAVALQSPEWHHERSFAPERARRDETVALWRKIITTEDPEWTRRYHSTDQAEKAFGGRVDIMLTDGRTIIDEIAVADAHPLGRRPFGRQDYIAKFRTLAAETLDPDEVERFLDVAQRLPELSADRFGELNIVGRPELLASVPTIPGLF